MEAGVDATDADAILFVDADCTGLTAAHLDAICEPFVDGRAVMSLGAFDYGRFWNPLVLRFAAADRRAHHPPLGVRGRSRPTKLDGYTIEMRINEVIAEGRLPTDGPDHGRRVPTAPSATSSAAGRARRTVGMYRELLGMLRPVGDVRLRTYWFYLRGLTIEA